MRNNYQTLEISTDQNGEIEIHATLIVDNVSSISN